MLHQIDLKGEPLDLDYTFDCGQIFQWRNVDGWWLGVVAGHAVLLRVDDGSLLVRSQDGFEEEALRNFLGLDSARSDVAAGRNLDDFSIFLLKEYRGLRVLRQDPWTCLVSYIVSASLSLRAIDRILERIAHGSEELQVEDYFIKSFPDPSRFVRLKRPEKAYLGKRWGYLKSAAEEVVRGTLDFQRLQRMGYEEAWESLVTSEEGHVLGVGPKVDDCVLLFSLNKPEAFPMDRWIMRGLSRHYSWLLSKRTVAQLAKGGSLTIGEYALTSKNLRSHFGDLGGLVQECLFLHMRTTASRLPLA